MNITLVGINHQSASIQIREKFAFSSNTLPEALIRLKADLNIKEAIILSTCNRVEVYVTALAYNKVQDSIINFLNSFHKVTKSEHNKYFYCLSGTKAIKHLFKVASSLDSQILGEPQILGQVKEAYLKAKNTGAALKIFSFIFEEAIKTGKLVRNVTKIGHGAVSISAAAVEMARKIFGDLSSKTVLIIGAGKTGELSAEYLYSRGAKMVIVANRTFSRAKKIAEKFHGNAIKFNDFPNAIQKADIVISSVNAPHVILKKEDMTQIMKDRNCKPLFIIDLGVPRNIDKGVNEIENVYVYNLDDLKKIKDANLEERLKEAEKIEKIIDKRIKAIRPKFQDMFTNEI